MAEGLYSLKKQQINQLGKYKMKFNTCYEKAREKININDYSDIHNYESELYEYFITEFADWNNDEFFIKSWRWNIQQNAIQAKGHGKKHIKTQLKEVFDAYYCEIN